MSGTYVLDRGTYEPVAYIEDYQQIQWKRSFFKAGSFQMQMNYNQFNARPIEQGMLIGIAIDPTKPFDHVYLIEAIEFNGSASSADETIMISGRDLKGFADERVIDPRPNPYLGHIGPSESLMKFYVNTQMGPGADDPARSIPNLFIQPDQGRGGEYQVQARWQKLSDLMEEIGRQDYLGWKIYFEEATQTFQMDTYFGFDRTETVFFDFDYESLLTQKVLKTDLGRKSFAYVGGDGEGSNREVATTYLAAAEPSGFARRETFVDAQDQDNASAPDILQFKGRAALRESDIDDAVDLDLNTFGPFVYRVDWDLGDVVNVRNRRWNFKKAMRIITVTNTITPDMPRVQTAIELDKPYPTLLEKIKDGFSRYDAGRRI